MSDLFKPNWQRGRFYFWVPKSTLAVCYIGRGVARAAGIKAVPAFVDKPTKGDFHRVHIDVVRTKAEAAAAKRAWEKKRAKFAQKLKAHA